MSYFESNYDCLKCVICDNYLTRRNDKFLIVELEDEEEGLFDCPFCGEKIKIELNIYKEYNYSVTELTEEEKKAMTENKLEEDVPGQILMWEES